ncbi:GTP-binding protein [Mycena venus]|uniref:GTP-binding protein n=1 Tax=Mycena venus TaxID=2733690 RepID=A0A8H6XXH2_9AGAR|nr:GTP-binding protein [Mycena venus]
MARDIDKAIELRSKCKHFRVLVIGRANAGKTTLLKKVCNSVEDPEIFSPEGKKVSLATPFHHIQAELLQLDATIVEGSASRGLHDIENQLIFKSNPQFIFHDSRGFESGSIDETEKVKAFIATRAGGNTLSEQLHAIWYCLPTDTNRPLLKADEDFFNIDVTGKGNPEEADEQTAQRAQEMLANHFQQPLRGARFPPSDHVQLDDMREKASSCNELIEKTANALTDDTLRLLFVSVQQNNIYLCIQYAIEASLERNIYWWMKFSKQWKLGLTSTVVPRSRGGSTG